MISDLNAHNSNSFIETDICIIGAGVAGLGIAKEFLDTSTNILIIESGGKKDEINTQRLYESEVIGMPHEGVHNGRFRVYGGSSTRWGAQLMTFEPIDFDARAYQKDSGWPISYDEVSGFCSRAEDLLKVNHLAYEDKLWDELKLDPIGFNKNILSYRFSKWAAFKNRNLAKTVGPLCQASKNINILLHANLKELIPVENQTSIKHIVVKSLSGKQATITAKKFIICCGAIETARVLLASNSVIPSGIGNQNDLVGRYFQDHISVRAARLRPDNNKKFTETFDPVFQGSTMHSCKVSMTQEMQRKHKCLNVMGHVVYGFTEESGLYELRKILRAVQSKKNPIPSPMGAWRILRFSSDVFRMVFGQFLAKRRLSPKFAKSYLDIECEQAPSYDSRVMLSDEVDDLGMPKTKLDWRLSEMEKHTVKTYVEMFEKEWKRLSLGKVEWDDSIFENNDKWLDICRDTYHHAGTTRMSDDENSGVVDLNLKVHGFDNLYIGSTSVFPTSGCANPTLTMMALCVRLADHLKSQGV